MQLFSGQIFTFLILGLFKFSFPQLIAVNSDTKVKSRQPRDTIQLVPEVNKFVLNYHEAVAACEENHAFLAELTTPLTFNYAYDLVERLVPESSKYSIEQN